MSDVIPQKCESVQKKLEASCPLSEKVPPHMSKILVYLKSTKSAKGEPMLDVYHRFLHEYDSLEPLNSFLSKLARKAGIKRKFSAEEIKI